MKKEIVKIEGINNKPGTFNHVVKVNGFLFLSSQLSCDLKTGETIHGNIKEQTKRAMDNIKFLIEGAEPSKVSIQAPSPVPGIDIEIEATTALRSL
ncbi:MAG: Rid family hydrolase [Pseudomonadota bacterium]